MGKLLEYDVSMDELDCFIDMFDLWPIYTCVEDIPPLALVPISDGSILCNNWEAPFRPEVWPYF